MTSVASLRQTVSGEIFDYQQLSDCLREYQKPRDKISLMLRRGEIIRVKKGIYVFGKAYRRRSLSREVLANLLYGPSYISLEYALSYYHLIPEQVRELTSVTTHKTRIFDTPLGRFRYRTLSARKYSAGIDLSLSDSENGFLVATPAKALIDKLWCDHFSPHTLKDIQKYLMEDLRIDSEGIAKIDLAEMQALSKQHGSRKVRLLFEYLDSTRRLSR